MKLARMLFTVSWVCAWIIAGWATGAAADIYWEATQTTEGMPGQADGTQTVKNYLSEQGSRTESNGMVMILDLKKSTMYQIKPQQKTYSEINIQELASQLPGGDDQSAQEMQQFMKKMMGSPQVVPTNETRTINGYQCKKYLVNFMMAETEYWLTKDIPAIKEAQELGQKMAEALSESPMLKQMNVGAMLKDLDGFPVETIVKVMQGQITTTLTKIEQKKLGVDLFAVPQGYQKVAPE